MAEHAMAHKLVSNLTPARFRRCAAVGNKAILRALPQLEGAEFGILHEKTRKKKKKRKHRKDSFKAFATKATDEAAANAESGN